MIRHDKNPSVKIKRDEHHAGITVMILVALLGFTRAGLAGEENPTLAWGKDIYMTYCGSCHGESGKGDGPAAAGLKAFPPDLTYISTRYGGAFPQTLVKNYIDGEQPIAAHGSRQMPVWGKLFRRDKSDTEARMQISALTTYLESIQSNPER
mgnify:CR=1 FL=1